MNRSRRIAPDVKADPTIRDALRAWQAAVVLLDGVDPVTSELVRLRCARHHDCRT